MRSSLSAALPWLAATGFAFLAGLLWAGRGGDGVAHAQQNPAGARGVYAFAGQLDSNTHGLFMIDIEQQTLWVYELDTDEAGVRKLRLAAARSWLYDRYLKDFNTDGLNYLQIEELVSKQRQQAP